MSSVQKILAKTKKKLGLSGDIRRKQRVVRWGEKAILARSSQSGTIINNKNLLLWKSFGEGYFSRM